MSTEIVKVPDIGDASDVEVIEVMVAVGDEIAPEQSLIVLESDKASMEIPSSAAGKVLELKLAVGDKVSEGDPILVLEAAGAAGDGADSDAGKAVGGASAPQEPAGGSPVSGGTVGGVSTPPEPSGSDGGTEAQATVESVKVPDIGGAEGVTVIEVCVQDGAQIAEGDPIVVLESDKASMEVPSPRAGTVRAVKVAVNDTVSEGSPLLDLEVSGTSDDRTVGGASAPQDPAGMESGVKTPPTSTPQQDSAVSEAEAPPAAPPQPAADKPPQAASDAPQAAVHAGPAVRRLAREFGVDLREVGGSGRKGRILKEDVQRFVRERLSRGGGAAGGTGLPEMPVVDFSKFGPIERVELSKINKLSAANLHRSWLHVPHVTQFDEADISDLEAFRKQHNASLGEGGTKLTLLPFIVKACAHALSRYPRFNSSLDASGESLILKQYIHIGIAVDTPDGLVVPVVRDADRKSITELAVACAELAGKARNRRLSPADMAGGCFSISSLGGIGGTAFTPIVNAPEVAILGVSKSSLKPVYDGSGFAPRLMLPLSLSYDHRVIDGAAAARFTAELAALLGDIRRLLL